MHRHVYVITRQLHLREEDNTITVIRVGDGNSIVAIGSSLDAIETQVYDMWDDTYTVIDSDVSDISDMAPLVLGELIGIVSNATDASDTKPHLINPSPLCTVPSRVTEFIVRYTELPPIMLQHN